MREEIGHHHNHGQPPAEEQGSTEKEMIEIENKKRNLRNLLQPGGWLSIWEKGTIRKGATPEPKNLVSFVYDRWGGGACASKKGQKLAGGSVTGCGIYLGCSMSASFGAQTGDLRKRLGGGIKKKKGGENNWATPTSDPQSLNKSAIQKVQKKERSIWEH